MNRHFNRLSRTDLDALIREAEVISRVLKLNETQKRQLIYYVGYLTVTDLRMPLCLTNEQLVKRALQRNYEEVQKLQKCRNIEILTAGMQKGIEAGTADIKA